MQKKSGRMQGNRENMEKRNRRDSENRGGREEHVELLVQT
jgi:hypothetical protein